jgi:peptide/nickel transport system substrate-binding protein
LFWYENIILNDELTPAKPKSWSPGGDLVRIEKSDDRTVTFTFTVPYPPALTILGTGPGNEPFAPKHYLMTWHIDYNENAGDQATREGFDSWWQAFANHRQGTNNRQATVDMNLPFLDPWVMKEIDSFGNKYFERNPYYWKVDTEGNQLPYMDKASRILTENMELLNLKVLAGDVDIVGSYLNIQDFPVYKEGEQDGGYQIRLWPSAYGNHVAYAFNLTHQDPVLREVFGDLRFRQAMSVAINREEINEVVQFGRATPRQATTLPVTSFYEDWMGEYYAQYDPDMANGLLDDMGLEWDANHEFRLRPDGKTLSIVMEYTEAGGGAPKGAVSELVKEYWEAVGVQCTLKEIERTLLEERRSANELDVGIWHLDGVAEGAMHADPSQLRPPFCGNSVCYPWWTWYTSGGESGEEPPQLIKDLFTEIDEWQQLLPGTDRYEELGKELLTINLENLWTIGTTGMVAFPIMVKNGLENAAGEAIWGWDFRYFNPYRGDQWFWSV